MKRILLMVIRLFYLAPGWYYRICKYGSSDFYSEEERYQLIRDKIKKINRAGRVIVDSYGTEELPNQGGYVIFPNHQGMFDTLALFETHQRPLTCILKKEMEHVFFVKKVIQLLKAQLIDREDIKQSMEVIRKTTKEVIDGRIYVIFAEGTRSRKQNELLEFKGGSFKSAMYAKCPIVPVALIDSYKAFDTGSIERLTVQIHYLKPLYYEEYSNMKSTEIASEVKRRIEETIQVFE